jgi:hypothetical protein
MAIYTPTYGGRPIFGLAVRIEQIPTECGQQTDSFMGVGGVLSLFAGSRGRSFSVSGVLYDVDLPTLNLDEDVFTPGVSGTLADGVARVLFDTRGRTWANVVYLGQFSPDPMGPRPGTWGGYTNAGWILPYKAVFHGLS